MNRPLQGHHSPGDDSTDPASLKVPAASVPGTAADIAPVLQLHNIDIVHGCA